METVQQPTNQIEEERWLKFNDTIVEEFLLMDSTLESECFGGSIKSNTADPCKHCIYSGTSLYNGHIGTCTLYIEVYFI